MRDKLNNLILFDKPTYEKLYKEVPTYKLITPAVVSERLKVRLCLCVVCGLCVYLCVCVCSGHKHMTGQFAVNDSNSFFVENETTVLHWLL